MVPLDTGVTNILNQKLLHQCLMRLFKVNGKKHGMTGIHGVTGMTWKGSAKDMWQMTGVMMDGTLMTGPLMLGHGKTGQMAGQVMTGQLYGT